jgi:hypothetical protein
MAATDDPLKYKQNATLRREIAYAVGGDPARYTAGDDLFVVADLRRIAEALGIDATNIERHTLLNRVATETGEPLTGRCARNLRRAHLKAIHERVGGRDPTEVPSA